MNTKTRTIKKISNVDARSLKFEAEFELLFLKRFHRIFQKSREFFVIFGDV